MSSDSVNLQQVLDAIEALRDEVGSLGERVRALEDPGNRVRTAEEQEELVATISAAVAAYLGEKPHIRQIRLLSNDSWARFGRASVQASHKLTIIDR